MFTIICWTNSCKSQSTVDTMSVWKGAKWGMTIEQVQSLFTGEIIKLEEPEKYDNGTFCPLIIAEIEILADKYKASFLFDNQEKKLILISLSLIDKNAAVETIFNFLEQELTKKYSVPIYNSKEEYIWKTTWKTNISFIDLDFFNGLTKFLIISYKPISNSSSNL